MSKDYNAKYDTNDVNGRDVIEASASKSTSNQGPAFTTNQKENVYHDDYGKHSILHGGEDKTGPTFARQDGENVHNVDHGKDSVLVNGSETMNGPAFK